MSFASVPQFRPGHVLVVPRRHIESASELLPEESAALMAEIGRLSALLDEGFGYGMMQKFQPTQAENGIKMNHMHVHLFPRQEHEAQLFPTPTPNNFDGFYQPDPAATAALVEHLR